MSFSFTFFSRSAHAVLAPWSQIFQNNDMERSCGSVRAYADHRLHCESPRKKLVFAACCSGARRIVADRHPRTALSITEPACTQSYDRGGTVPPGPLITHANGSSNSAIYFCYFYLSSRVGQMWAFSCERVFYIVAMPLLRFVLDWRAIPCGGPPCSVCPAVKRRCRKTHLILTLR
jgi:hypothetical protein